LPELPPEEPEDDEPDDDPELAEEVEGDAAGEEPDEAAAVLLPVSDFAAPFFELSDLLSALLLLSEDEAAVLSELEPLELEYRSLYQPPPLSMNAVWLISRSTSSLPHFGHFLIAGSLIFCHSSN
jgi:hypothetical protein